MIRALILLLALAALPAAAQVDPRLVGMWKLEWTGPDVWWQVRGDGVYRVIGTGATPYEHWGRMTASPDGQWTSEWEQGSDRGQFSRRGADGWTVQTTLGSGNWARVWPAAGASSPSTCPHIDVKAVESVFASVVELRTRGEVCEFRASRVGGSDELSIDAQTVTPQSDGLRNKRADCANGTNRDPGVRCMRGLGDAALFHNGSLHVYRGDRLYSLRLQMQPRNAVVRDADLVTLARALLGLPGAVSPGFAGVAPVQPSAQAAAATTLPDIIDPCKLVTAEEAQRVLGVAVTTDRRTPQPRTQNDCRYRADSTRQLAVRTYNGGGLDVAGALAQRLGRGAQRLDGIGDAASLDARPNAPGVSLEFYVGRASVTIEMFGAAREQAATAVQSLAAAAATRLTGGAGLFDVPGTAAFAGTWIVRAEGGSAPPLLAAADERGRVRMQTVDGFAGKTMFANGSFRIDNFARVLEGTYALERETLVVRGTVQVALTRVACGAAPRFRPPYDLARDVAALLSGRNLRQIDPNAAAGAIDPKLVGLWEGEGTLGARRAQVLWAIDDRGRTALITFPIVEAQLDAAGGNYRMMVGTETSSGRYEWLGGVSDGSVRVHEGAQSFLWARHDPERHPPFETPIVGHCG